ncbi:hypothetical protein CCX46_23435 [Pseudomonas sp. RU47]|uniref:hypothetical protein n=1 Tax=Pseudomonas TaxID=286 RepID=UPI000FDDD71D|nr:MULTISPECIES: hypothetical protein [Pseudomonas]AZZ77965.1 hypothetical protein CCX46_23435 [Pseudomonas sp. RU47]VVQ31437.1 hypothetical protein PS947_02456 [Pseudomonas fluorescens]
MDDEIGESESGDEQKSESKAQTNRVPDESLADKASFVGVGEGEQYSEVFWDNAVTTTLYQIHPRVPSLTTLLECQYKFDSEHIHVRTVKYKMTTRGGNRDRANIDVVLKAGGYERKNSPDTMRQDAQWHNYVVTLSVPLGTYDVEVYLQMRIQYDGPDNDVEDWEGWSDKIIPARTPVIQSPLPNTLVTMPFLVKGNGHWQKGAIRILGPRENIIGIAALKGDGNWEASIYLPLEDMSFYAKQVVGTEISVASNVIKIRQFVTSITSPVENAWVTHPQLFFSGTCISGTTITVVEAKDHAATLSTPRVFNSISWNVGLKPDKTLPSGNLAIQARQQSPGWSDSYSAVVNVMVLGYPVISTSAPLQNPSFKLEGGNGVKGAVVEIFQNSTSKLLGRSAVLTSDKWVVDLINVPSGNLSLVAEQVITIHRSGRGTPQTFKIIPPVVEITGPDSNVPQNTSFTLTGKGAVANATIKVLKDLGNDPPLASKVVVAAGDWSIQLTGLAPGVLSLVAVQEVDGIPSARSGARPFKIRPPKLTAPDVTYPTDSTVKFSGNGHDRATVQITINSGPSPTPPPSVGVASGKWETIATNWAAGEYALTIVQKLSDGAGGWIESLPLDFTFDKTLPDVSDLKHTVEYRPTFSGKGFNGATVHVFCPDRVNLAAPETVVVGNEWSTTASAVWGPSNDREVHVKQTLNGQWSPNWRILKVRTPPLAPGLNVPSEEGLCPEFSGTGWSTAKVHINFSDDPQPYVVTVVAEVWTFRRTTPFSGNTLHKIEVHQVAEGLDSPKVARTFTVYPVIEQPVIIYPPEGKEVPRDISVTGSGGMEGATMRLWDDRYEKYLTPPQLVPPGGEWSIDLRGLTFEEHAIRAEQTIYARPFKRSEQRKFKAVVPPPEFTCPSDGQKLSRTSTLSGKGMPYAQVKVWMLGDTSAPFTEARVDRTGDWNAEVTLPVGEKTIWAVQIYDNDGDPQTSKDSDRVTYQVVPKAPDIESPTKDDHAGRVLVVSGFGVSGDTVTVKVGSTHQSAPVKADRTWWVRLELNQPGGEPLLEVVSALGEFVSEPATRPIVLGTYWPTIEVPAPGSWVANPVSLAGNGRQGVGAVVSWFNPDLELSANIPVDPLNGWQAQAGPSLMTGGQWSRFRQSLNDSEKRSDWVDSERFEVEPGSSKRS